MSVLLEEGRCSHGRQEMILGLPFHLHGATANSQTLTHGTELKHCLPICESTIFTYLHEKKGLSVLSSNIKKIKATLTISKKHI